MTGAKKRSCSKERHVANEAALPPATPSEAAHGYQPIAFWPRFWSVLVHGVKQMPLPLPDSTVMPPLIENSSAGGMKRTGEMKRSIDSRVNLPELELQIQKESHREQRDAVISIFRECVAAGDQAMADGATSEAGGACSGAAADGMLRATQQYKRAAEAFIRERRAPRRPAPRALTGLVAADSSLSLRFGQVRRGYRCRRRRPECGTREPWRARTASAGARARRAR